MQDSKGSEIHPDVEIRPTGVLERLRACARVCARARARARSWSASSRGSELLTSHNADITIYAGLNPRSDSYSVFRDNDKRTMSPLAEILNAVGAEEVYCCGLATDYCVQFSALDCKILSKARVFVVSDACRGISEASVRKAYSTFAMEQISLISSDDDAIRSIPDATTVLVPQEIPLGSAAVDVQHTLLAAAMYLDVRMVHAAIAAGGDVRVAPLPQGRNALHYACAARTRDDPRRQEAQLAIVTALLKRGERMDASYVDVRTQSEAVNAAGHTALLLAAEGGSDRVIEVLLTAGANPNLSEDSESLTPLMHACTWPPRARGRGRALWALAGVRLMDVRAQAARGTPSLWASCSARAPCWTPPRSLRKQRSCTRARRRAAWSPRARRCGCCSGASLRGRSRA